MKNQRLISILIFFTIIPFAHALDVVITPPEPIDSDSLYCSLENSENSAFFEYIWMRNQLITPHSTSTIPASATSASDTWTCYINLFGSNIGYDSVSIQPDPQPDLQPSVNLSASPQQGINPLDVSATCSVYSGDAPVQMVLDFGDGTQFTTTSSSIAKTHTYNSLGNFEITCTATDSDNDTDSASETIVVIEDLQPTASCNVQPSSGLAPLTAEFTGSASGGNVPLDYSWDFGDGTSAQDSNATHAYLNSGVYFATFSVTDVDGDSDVCTKTITVNEDIRPAAQLSINPNSGLEPLSAEISCSGSPGNEPSTFFLEYGDGTAAIESETPIFVAHTFQSAGDYAVKCQITDSDNDQDISTSTVNVFANLNPEVTFSATPTSGLQPFQTNFLCNRFSGNNPVTLSVDYGDGTHYSTTDSSISQYHTYHAAGNYNASCTATDSDGDTDSQSILINVIADTTPVLECSATPTSGLAPLSVQFTGSAYGGNGNIDYTWTFGDGSVSFNPNAAHTYVDSSQYNAILTAVDEDGDSDTCNVNINVGTDSTPTALLSATPMEGLEPLTTTLSCNGYGGNSPLIYVLDYDDGSPAITQSNPIVVSHKYNEGQYTPTCDVTDSDGDLDSDQTTITVHEDLNISVDCSADPLEGIAPLSVDFSASVSGGNQPISYTWNFDDGSTSPILNPSYTYHEAGTYNAVFRAVDSNGDSDSCTRVIRVEADESPEVSLSVAPTQGLAPLIIEAQCSRIGGNPDVNLKLGFGDGTDYSTLSNSLFKTHTYAAPGNYEVTCLAVDANNDSDIESQIVSAIEDSEPTAFCDADPVAGLAPLSVYFSSSSAGGNSPIAYSWLFGDGGSTDTPNVYYTYDNAGSFNATLTVTDSDGDTDTCTRLISVIEDSQPSLDFIMTPNQGLAPHTAHYTCSRSGGNDPVEITLSFGDGHTISSNDSIIEGAHTYDSKGEYVATCQAEDSDGDFDERSENIFVIEDLQPDVSFFASPQTGYSPLDVEFICGGSPGNEPAVYTLSFGDNASDIQSSMPITAVHEYSYSGTYEPTCSIVDANGDEDFVSKTIHSLEDSKPTAHCQANPTSGFAPLNVDFSAWATGGNGVIEYSWIFGDGGSSDTANVTYTYNNSKTYVATLTVTDENGDTDTCQQTIEVLEDVQPAPLISVNPNTGYAPLNAAVSCFGAAGNEPSEYVLVLGDGTPEITSSQPIFINHTYYAGLYHAQCLITDSNGDSESANESIEVTTDETPLLSFSATPTSGTAPLIVDFSCTATGGNGQLSYVLDYGDGTTFESVQPIYVSHTYQNNGSYLASCIATDEDGDFDSETEVISVSQESLNITGIECFERVILGGNQSCSVYVEDNNGAPVENANIKVYYSDGSFFGGCFSDHISGGCEVKDVQEELGYKTVFATAEHDEYVPDNDGQLTFTFEVWDHRYDIVDLKVYNNPEYTNEDYDFFRGEDIYVKFRVIDENNPETGYISNMVTKATLVSPPGGRAELTKVNENQWYYYKLTPIPPTHDFLGLSQVFTFAFNFTDHTGGQAQVDLTIRNNPPEIRPLIPDVTLYVNESVTIDLSMHEFDIEDSGSDLIWSISSIQGPLAANLSGKMVRLSADSLGDGYFDVKLTDLNLDSDTQRVYVTVIDYDTRPVAICNADPTSGLAPLTVHFTGSSTSGNGPIQYSWIFDDGGSTDSANVYYTYNNSGSFTAVLTVTDSDGDTDTCRKIINVGEDLKPEVDFTANPTFGTVPLDVDFYCGGTPGNEPTEHTLDFGDGSPSIESSSAIITQHSYTSSGSYDAVCTIVDSDGDADSKIIQISASQPVLNVTSLECFERVLIGANQSCSAYVEDEDGEQVNDALVSIYYITDTGGNTELFGTCRTDSISGGCAVMDVQEELGGHLVFATAHKDGYTSDEDMHPLFHYEVWDHRYDIVDLKVYNNPEYTNEDYDFFRGEDMYVKFRVIDENNPETDYISNMVTKATLVSPPGGRAELTKVNENQWYYYQLTPIPPTHDFLGLSQVFTFAFNFTDHTGGQAQVDLTIRNNPPIITPPVPDVSMLDNETVTIDLSMHEFDVEDSGSDLTWSLRGVSGDIEVVLDEKFVTIVPRGSGSGAFEVVLMDLDRDTDSQWVGVNVNVSNIAPVADAGDDITVYIGEEAQFDGSSSYDPLGSIESYLWDFGDGSSSEGVEVSHIFDELGEFTATLTVTDDGGLTDSDTLIVNVIKKPVGVYIIADPREGPAPLKVRFMAVGQGRDPIEYYWDFGDGTGGFGKVVYHTYDKKGRYSAMVRAVDVDGDEATAAVTIHVSAEENINVIDRRRFYIGQLQVINDDSVKPGDQLKVLVEVHNNGNREAEDVKITGYLLGLSQRIRLGPFDLNPGEKTNRILLMDVPYAAYPGVYDLRVTVSNDETSRTKYREVIVQP